jgi:hypothetical protein
MLSLSLLIKKTNAKKGESVIEKNYSMREQ